jgi:hypothetical protein
MGGECVEVSNRNLVVIQGNNQTAYPDQQLPLMVTVKLVNASFLAVVGEAVTVTPPPGAAVTPGTINTNGQGRASFYLRLGLLPGAQEFTVTSTTATPVVVRATATVPPTGTVFTIVNVDRTEAYDGFPGPGTLAHIRSPTPNGIAVSYDGTIYIAVPGSYGLRTAKVMRLSSAGELTRFAGLDGPNSGSCTPDGDNGPADQAWFCDMAAYAYDSVGSGIALDEATNSLFVAADNRVRRIDLASGIITLYAGGASGYVEGALANTVSVPGTLVRVGPDGWLYIIRGRGAGAHNQPYPVGAVWRINPSTGRIYTLFNGGIPMCNPASSYPAAEHIAEMAWDPVTGDAWLLVVDHNHYGSDLVSAKYSIVHRTSSGSFECKVFCSAEPCSANDGEASDHFDLGFHWYFQWAGPALAFDPAGKLVFGGNSSHLSWYDPSQEKVFDYALTGASVADYVSSSEAKLTSETVVTNLVFTYDGHAVFSSSVGRDGVAGGFVRMIW